MIIPYIVVANITVSEMLNLKKRFFKKAWEKRIR